MLVVGHRVHAVEGMGHVDQPALALDLGDRLREAQPAGDLPLDEQPDDLALGGLDLLPDDHLHGRRRACSRACRAPEISLWSVTAIAPRPCSRAVASRPPRASRSRRSGRCACAGPRRSAAAVARCSVGSPRVAPARGQLAVELLQLARRAPSELGARGHRRPGSVEPAPRRSRVRSVPGSSRYSPGKWRSMSSRRRRVAGRARVQAPEERLHEAPCQRASRAAARSERGRSRRSASATGAAPSSRRSARTARARARSPAAGALSSSSIVRATSIGSAGAPACVGAAAGMSSTSPTASTSGWPGSCPRAALPVARARAAAPAARPARAPASARARGSGRDGRAGRAPPRPRDVALTSLARLPRVGRDVGDRKRLRHGLRLSAAIRSGRRGAARLLGPCPSFARGRRALRCAGAVAPGGAAAAWGPARRRSWR